MTMSVLRAARSEDFDFIHQIASRPENATYIEDSPDEALQEFLDSADAPLLIWEHDQKVAGFALFCELAHPGNQTELRRLGLGRTDLGLGQPFVADLVAYGFETLGKDRVWLEVVPTNPRAIRSYEKTGFRQDHAAQSVWQRPDGTRVDQLVFEMMRDDWRN